MKLRIWLKYVLWTAIITNILYASRTTKVWTHIYNQSGWFLASITSLFFLLFFGILFGTIMWGISLLITIKKSVDVSWNYIYGLTLILILLVVIGNLQTLVVFGLYKLIKAISAKIKKNK